MEDFWGGITISACFHRTANRVVSQNEIARDESLGLHYLDFACLALETSVPRIFVLPVAAPATWFQHRVTPSGIRD